MKKFLLTILVLVVAFCFFTTTPASAGNDHRREDNRRGGPKKNTPTNLPINNGSWFLLLAGAAVGCVVLTKRKTWMFKSFN